LINNSVGGGGKGKGLPPLIRKKKEKKESSFLFRNEEATIKKMTRAHERGRKGGKIILTFSVSPEKSDDYRSRKEESTGPLAREG